jgi:nucleotide-binding universal stress UspA family protein
MYKRILVATDGSELSAKAVESAIALASSLKAELFALKVVQRYPHSYFEGALPIDMKETARVEAGWAAAAQKVIDGVVAAAQVRDVAVHGLVIQSDQVSESVISAARKHECDLIVMASHGRKGVSRLLLGSETQHVLTHSHIPVLVLR